MFQEMWERGLDWDEELPIDLTTCWKEWCKELQDVSKVSINRRYDKQLNLNKNSQEMQEIHVFCDDSDRAYCAAAYLRMTKSDGTRTVNVISAKAKVSPLKHVTLPQLELLVALISARRGNYLSNILSLNNVKCNFWTDSMITVYWIKSTARQWKLFVAKIQILTLPENWRHCKRKENPADHGTRINLIIFDKMTTRLMPVLHKMKTKNDGTECVENQCTHSIPPLPHTALIR